MTEQENVQLLPCPFCGSETDILTAAGNICDYWITCANCGADGAWKDTMAESIAAWNTRHTATAEALEALRYCAEAPLSGWTIAQSVARAAIAKIEGQQP